MAVSREEKWYPTILRMICFGIHFGSDDGERRKVFADARQDQLPAISCFACDGYRRLKLSRKRKVGRDQPNEATETEIERAVLATQLQAAVAQSGGCYCCYC